MIFIIIIFFLNIMFTFKTFLKDIFCFKKTPKTFHGSVTELQIPVISSLIITCIGISKQQQPVTFNSFCYWKNLFQVVHVIIGWHLVNGQWVAIDDRNRFPLVLIQIKFKYI